MEQYPSSIRPSTAPILFIFLGMAGLLLAWLLPVAVGAGLLICALIVYIALVYWLSKNPYICLLVLLIAADTPRISFKLFGLRAEPEHIVSGILLAATIWMVRRRGTGFSWTLPDVLVMAYIGLNYFSSLAASVAPPQTLKWSTQQTLAILPYFYIRILAGSDERFQRAVHTFVTVSSIVAAYALLCYVSHVVLGTEFGVGADFYGGISAAYGTQSEPNILGSFAGASFIFALMLYLKERRRRLFLCVLVTGGAMAVSMSRGALGATAIAAVMCLFAARRMGLIDKVLAKKLTITVAIAGVAFASVLLPFYLQRFGSLSVSNLAQDEDTRWRLLTYALAYEDIVHKPLLGNGTASLQLMFTYEDMGYGDMDAGAWVGNAEMRIWHDTGIVGLTIFCAFVVILCIRSIKLLKRRFNLELLAFLLSAMVYVIAFQATEGTMLAFPWVHFGFLATAVSLARASNLNGENLESGPSNALASPAK